jgi:hypothetical protein
MNEDCVLVISLLPTHAEPCIEQVLPTPPTALPKNACTMAPRRLPTDARRDRLRGRRGARRRGEGALTARDADPAGLGCRPADGRETLTHGLPSGFHEIVMLLC